MKVELLGVKLGQTRVYRDDGTSVAVTLVEVTPNRVVQVKQVARDGYSALQLTFGSQKNQRISKALRMHYATNHSAPGRGIVECRVSQQDAQTVKPGSELTIKVFEDVTEVDVIGTSKGKGFAGGIKRWNFRRQDETHGNSLSHRAPGSIGQCQFPGRVFKGKKMAGHMGARRVTQLSLGVERCDEKANLLVIRGAVPGSNGSVVRIRPAIKAQSSHSRVGS